MIVAYLLVVVAVGLLMAGGGSWSQGLKPAWARRYGSPRYLVWATAALVVATLIVFAEHRTSQGFVFVGVTAAVAVLSFLRYRDR